MKFGKRNLLISLTWKRSAAGPRGNRNKRYNFFFIYIFLLSNGFSAMTRFWHD